MTNSIPALIATFSLFCLAGLGVVNYTTPAVVEEAAAVGPLVKTPKYVGNDFARAMMKEGIPDLVYKVDSRYLHRATGEQLKNAQTILDLLLARATPNIITYESVSVTNLDEEYEITAVGGPDFSAEQRDYLQSIDYSTNVLIRSDYLMSTGPTDFAGQADYLTYYYTIVPEREAAYREGKDELIDYLRSGSAEAVRVITQEGLRPGRVFFTVTEAGAISNVRLEATSGYDEVDEKLVNLVKNVPGAWQPARNANGEAVAQTLVFFFGLEGC